MNDRRDFSKGYVGYVMGLLSLVNVFNYMDRMALAVLLPSLKRDLQLSDGQLGVLVGFAFALFYALCGLPMARWADRGIRRNIIAVTLGIWSVMTALSGAAPRFGYLFAARVGVGVGEAGCFPAAQSMLCDYVPLKGRASALALHGCGTIVGIMLGMGLAGGLGERIGWRWTFVVLGLPGLALALIVRLSLREPQRGRWEGAIPTTAASAADTMRTLWSRKTYRWLMLVLVANGFVQYGLNQWWPSLYSRSFGLSVSSLGAYLGTAIGVGSALGLLLGGLWADKAMAHNRRMPLIVGAVMVVLAIPAALGSVFAPSARLALGFVALSGLCWSVPTGAVVAGVHSVVPPQMRASAIAVTIFFTAVFGFGLGPFCVGWLSEHLSASLREEALRYALLAPIGVLPLMAIALLAAAKTLPGDLKP